MRHGPIALLATFTLIACDPTPEPKPTRAAVPVPVPVPDPVPDPSPPDPEQAEDTDEDTDGEPEEPLLAAPVPEPDVDPVEARVTNRAMMVYTEPSYAAPFRGKLNRKATFWLLETVGRADKHCRGQGWGRIDVGGYVCLEHTEKTAAEPELLPRVRPGQLTPFYYGRLSKNATTASPRWRTRGAMKTGAEPLDELQPEHDYAFVHRRRTRDGVVLTDRAFRAVRERDIKRLKPSDFEGRDLLENPVPEGVTLAWSVTWRHAPLYERPHPDAKVVGRIKFQRRFYVQGDPVQHRRDEFHPVQGGLGWVDVKDHRRWMPVPPRPSDVGDDEQWIDVELGQQTLTVMRGDRPEFVTLISSGSHKHPTPRGVYRIVSKLAYGDMRSRESDDESYYVEAVPWVQYFAGRYALHGTFWHNRFGRRTSHGCINLSAKDAAHVYALTTPDVEEGWVLTYEHPHDMGTVVRIRKPDDLVPDKRKPVRARRARKGKS